MLIALTLVAFLQSNAPVEDKTCRDAFRAFEQSVEQAKSLKVKFQTSAYKKDGYSFLVDGELLIKGDLIRADLVENDPGGLEQNRLSKPKRIRSDGKKLLAYYGDEKVLEIDTPKPFRANLLTVLTRLGVGAPLAELPLSSEPLLLGKKGDPDWVLKPKVRVEFLTFPNAHPHGPQDPIGYTLKIEDGTKAGLQGTGSMIPGRKDLPLMSRRTQLNTGANPGRDFRLSTMEIWREFTLDPVLADEEFSLPAEKK